MGTMNSSTDRDFTVQQINNKVEIEIFTFANMFSYMNIGNSENVELCMNFSRRHNDHSQCLSLGLL